MENYSISLKDGVLTVQGQSLLVSALRSWALARKEGGSMELILADLPEKGIFTGLKDMIESSCDHLSLKVIKEGFSLRLKK